MDQWHAIAGLVGFSAGFWLRGQSEAKVDPPACHCQCQWRWCPHREHNVSGQSSSLWGILLAIAVVTVVVWVTWLWFARLLYGKVHRGPLENFRWTSRAKVRAKESTEQPWVGHHWLVGMALQAGQLCYLNYGEAPPCVHTRLVLGTFKGLTTWFVPPMETNTLRHWMDQTQNWWDSTSGRMMAHCRMGLFQESLRFCPTYGCSAQCHSHCWQESGRSWAIETWLGSCGCPCTKPGRLGSGGVDTG